MANELTFKLTLNDDGTYKLKKFGAEVEKTQKKHETASKKMESDFGSMGTKAGIAFTAVSAATLAALKTAMDYGGAIDDNAQKYGVSTKELGAMSLAAKMGGIEMDTLAGSMGKMAKMVNAANEGNAQSIATLKNLGIEWKNADGTLKNQTELLTQVSARFESMPDGIQKTAEAQKLFGKSGADMIPMLNAGAESMGELQNKAEQLGLALTAVQATDLAELGDSMDMLFEAAKGAAVQFTAEAAPGLKLFFEEFQDAIAGTMPFIKSLGEFASKVATEMSIGLHGAIGSIQKTMAAYAKFQEYNFKAQSKLTWGDTRKAYEQEAQDWHDLAAKYSAKGQEHFDRGAEIDSLNYNLPKSSSNKKKTLPPSNRSSDPAPNSKSNKSTKEPKGPTTSTFDYTSTDERFGNKTLANQSDDLEQYRQNTIKKAEDQAKEIERMRMDMLKGRERDIAELEQNYKDQRQKMLDNAQGLALADQQYFEQKKALAEQYHQDDLQKQAEYISQMEDAWGAVGNLASQVSKTFGLEADNAINSVLKFGQAMIQIAQLQQAMAAGAIVPGIGMIAPIAGIATSIIGGLDGMFATGGIADKPMRIMAGEQGPEGILNARATRTLGKDFVHAANAGNFNALQIPARTSNRTTNITINSQGLSQRDIEQTVIPAIQRANRRI